MSTSPTSGRVAVITGASSGIGAATARALADDGYRVAVLARRLDRIEAIVQELGNGESTAGATNFWWAQRDSNPRHPRCKRDALTN